MTDKIERTREKVLKLGYYAVPLTKKNVVVFEWRTTCSKLAFNLSSGRDVTWKKFKDSENPDCKSAVPLFYAYLEPIKSLFQLNSQLYQHCLSFSGINYHNY